MVFLSGGTKKLTNLSAFLDEWGVKPGEGILEEPTLIHERKSKRHCGDL